MNFIKTIEKVTQDLDRREIRYALIGGFAMALRGVQRATVDMDFILMLEDLKHADSIFKGHGYTRVFRSENVSHYIAKEDELGRIDILHAFRGPTLSMLERADRISVIGDLALPVVEMEDIIGLKVQAAHNDPKRYESDWSDIRLMLQTMAETNETVDWERLDSYLGLFGLNHRLETMKEWYGSFN